MAVYCIPLIMSCLLACCFIAILLHSSTILVCKLYVFTLICHKYDIKMKEFMFLIHQQELSPGVYRWSIKMGQESSPMHIKWYCQRGKWTSEQELLINVQFHLTSKFLERNIWKVMDRHWYFEEQSVSGLIGQPMRMGHTISKCYLPGQMLPSQGPVETFPCSS